MAVRVTSKKYNEFKEHLRQHELIHGVQDVANIRNLARTFAGRYSLDHKVIQPLYCCFFTSICFERNIQLPDDYNDDNYYDPDGLYPDDKEIRKKVRRNELEIQKRSQELRNYIDERDNTTN